MPGNYSKYGNYKWGKISDPYKLTNAMQSSYDRRVHVARGFILYEDHLKEQEKELQLRKKNTALNEAWEHYQTLLGLVGEG